MENERQIQININGDTCTFNYVDESQTSKSKISGQQSLYGSLTNFDDLTLTPSKAADDYTPIHKNINKINRTKEIMAYNDEERNNLSYKMALKCAKKLAYDIYGGDYNDLYDCMQNNDIDGARELLRTINREYRKRIFSSQDITYILNNWDAVTDAYDKLD